jgi:monoamine oxidase
MSSCYDLIIVGAGAAGLRVGIEALKQNPSLRCCLLEKYNYVGGRIVTYRKDIPSIGKVQWENGAGRISRSHHRVHSLLRHYGLHTVPIGGDTRFLSKETHEITRNAFYDLHHMYLAPLRLLPKEDLATHTIEQLLVKTMGYRKALDLIIQFPYYSEMHVLRADLALDAFDTDMSSNEGFSVCIEGYQALTDHMLTDFLKRGGVLVQNFEATGVRDGDGVQVIGKEKGCRKGGKTVDRVMHANAVVLALHSYALHSIKGIKMPVLRHLDMPPLLRIYAVFPKRGGKVWFDDLPKIVTDSRLRYIIPYDPKKGIIMISYTEGPDADFWMRMRPKDVERRLYSEVQQLFPDRTIPPPLFVKMHPWTEGCTYWKPGTYDPHEESARSLHPMPRDLPHLFVCSESFSIHQSWVESAVEQADQLVQLPAFQERIMSEPKVV